MIIEVVLTLVVVGIVNLAIMYHRLRELLMERDEALEAVPPAVSAIHELIKEMREGITKKINNTDDEIYGIKNVLLKSQDEQLKILHQKIDLVKERIKNAPQNTKRTQPVDTPKKEIKES